VVGISKDPPDAKEKNMYGKKVMGTERTTVLVGPDGKVEKVFPKVKVEGHVASVLDSL
jgi:peroxiredoxin Q/BCP